jgi:gamma-glutamylcyclotransferase (GGCT)/AIG2-like uncharacterized protein YtfP
MMMTHPLFVYGTLKRGFHWNSKYLHHRLGAEYISDAITCDDFALVVGDCGVPYLLGDVSGEGAALNKIRGELWRVSDEALRGLDDYEGLSKGYYSRKLINVIDDDDNDSTSAFVYLLNSSSSELKTRQRINEYTLQMHKELYKPVRHIQVKQFNYFKIPSNWGNTTVSIDGSCDVPTS